MDYTFDEQTLSDLHKEAYGTRPHGEWFWTFWADADDDGKQKIWDDLIKVMDQAQADEADRKAYALESFEDDISDNINLGAKDRDQAIQWILQAQGLNNETDAGYICYSLGLDYNKGYQFEPFLVSFESKYGEAA